MPGFIIKTAKLTHILIKEQLKEPAALIWTLLFPSLMFYFLLLSRGDEPPFQTPYITYAAYYYGYLSASVAFFGFAFYLIGRRESGFVRSFAYVPRAKALLLSAQLLSYSIIAILYCSTLYLLTRPLFGPYDVLEFLSILIRYYVCFLIFCSGSLTVVKLPLNFQNASTFFSALLFVMLAVLLSSRLSRHSTLHALNDMNPLNVASNIMLMTGADLLGTAGITFIVLTMMLTAAVRWMPTQPAWSRY